MTKFILPVAFLLLVSGIFMSQVAIAAQEPAESEAELEKRLESARARLDEAAREISEITTRLHGDAMQNVIRMAHRDDGKRRAMIGVNIGERSENGKVSGVSPDGVVVLGVTPGGPAEKAGLKTGDILTTLNGKSLAGGGKTSNDKLAAIMEDVKPGESIKLEYTRDGKGRKVDLETGEMSAPHFSGFIAPGAGENFFSWNGHEGAPMPPTPGMPAMPSMPSMPMLAPMLAHRWGGMELVPLTPKLGEYFNTDKGLLVVRAPDLEGVELEEGDVILKIGDREPKDVRHAMRILRSYAPGEKADVEIIRKKRKRTIALKIDNDAALGAAPGFEYEFMTPGGDADVEFFIDEGADKGGDKEYTIRKKGRIDNQGAAVGEDGEARVIVEKKIIGT